jgi:membrane protease YdiL (CAAX protease family)
LNKYLLNERLKSFSLGKGSWYLDIFTGISLAAVYFILMFLERPIFSSLLPQGTPPSQEVIDLMMGLAADPLLLAIWLGPVVWIGVAAFEEMVRIFFLNCLWKLGHKRSWEVFSIVLVSVFTGVMHIYQGRSGIISVSIQGLVAGFFFYRYRRIWPLIISHGLYDSIQILMFVINIR